MQKSVSAKWSKVCFFIFAVALPFVLGGCGGKDLPTFNITGGWLIYHTTAGTPGEVGPDLFTFSQNDNDLTGTTPKGGPLTGNLSDVNVDFSWTESDATSYTYSGTVKGDGTMSGTWTSSTGQSGTWHAIFNAVALVNVVGNWNVFHTIDGTPGELGPDLFTFAQSGINTISGTTAEGQQITGTLSRFTITFFWVGSDGITYIYTGNVPSDGTNMSGTWTSPDGPSGTWRALKSS
ncbi:MAG: hypothetical protein M1497_05005 [Nitrospirae bacterium]|nr:hypothetical protein [Nitrospirota bacterium]